MQYLVDTLAIDAEGAGDSDLAPTPRGERQRHLRAC